MNHKYRVAIPILVFVCMALVALLAYRVNVSRTTQTLRPATEETSKPEPTPTPVSQPEIMIESLLRDNEFVTSPFKIVGKARGSWFFEGSFPIVLLNEKKEIIVQTTAQAKGNWMTADFVPFEATLKFDETHLTNAGTIVFKNDNPSGLSENEKTFSVPVVLVQ